MPSAGTWMDLETVIMSEISQTEISYDTPYMWNLKDDTNQHTYKTKTDSQTQRTVMLLPRWQEAVEKGRNGSLGLAEANSYIEDG